jgi:hypothetical protein
MFVVSAVLSGRGLCNELITRPEESYRLYCVVVCVLETSRMRWPWPALGRSATEKNPTSYLKFWDKTHLTNVSASPRLYVLCNVHMNSKVPTT